MMNLSDRYINCSIHSDSRRGSTLVIVIALLGVLALTGMVFYTFAIQEHSAAENFVEAAKSVNDGPPDIWRHLLRQVIIGPEDSEAGSKLYSPQRRHSLVSNAVGSDIYPGTGEGVDVVYNAGVPETSPAPTGDNLLDFVDSPVARAGAIARVTPEPDVGYTYPDINNLAVAYRGWAIRDNWEIDANGSGGGTPDPDEDRNGNGIFDQPATRFTQVPIIIPSFFRPQLMKSLELNRADGGYSFSVVCDPFWAYADDGGGNPVAITSSNRATVPYQQRSFRPHPMDIGGIQDDGTVILRYLTDDEAVSFGVAAGGFPFIPANLGTTDDDATIQGELGILTGAGETTIELDVDNDGDGIPEGIWMDLRFPVQQHTDSSGNVTHYVVLHSVTIYDLDALFNVNVHGNLTGLPRDATLPSATTNGYLTDTFVSRSNLGLSPAEVNPIWGLRHRNAAGGIIPTTGADEQDDQFTWHFGRAPATDVEQANMEWIYLKLGKVRVSDIATTPMLDELHTGVFGDPVLLANSVSPVSSPFAQVSELPRPGQSLSLDVTLSALPGDQSFGSRQAFDDNGDSSEGEQDIPNGIYRPFGHPLDYSGAGRHSDMGYPIYNNVSREFDTYTSTPSGGSVQDPRIPILLSDANSFGPERWRAYYQYHAVSTMTDTPNRYVLGPNATYDGFNSRISGTGDDLSHTPVEDALMEDPLEVVFDAAFVNRVDDNIFSISDMIALHLTNTDIDAAQDDISTRLTDLADFALNPDRPIGDPIDNREMFTTLSNTMRHIGVQRDARRAWEFSADTDGADTDGDGFPNGDGLPEFPPKFGTVNPYSNSDPFRPQLRALLLNEVGEAQDLIGSLPLSPNHIVDIANRTTATTLEGTSTFLAEIGNSGLEFRRLTDHPEADVDASVLSLNSTDLTYAPGMLAAYPPTTTAEREFWARRDRQQLARDIYVLLYTIGGAAEDSGGNILPLNQTSDPNGAAGTRVYSHEQLRRMAQLAVNMVDAMDNDDVITKFEYDKNLGTGWDLDDDPFTDDGFAAVAGATADGLYPEDHDLERGVVYGVEAQQLAFSEVLGVRSPEIAAADHPATPYDDQTGLRDFLYVELENVLPKALDLATTASTDGDSAIWRLARFDRTVATDPIADPTPPNNGAISVLEHVENVVDGGGRFTISVSSDTTLTSSALFVDLGDPIGAVYDGTYELIAPDVTDIVDSSSTGAAEPLTDIDVLHASHSAGSPRFEEFAGNNFLANLVTYAGNTPFDTHAAQVNPPADQGFSNSLPPNHTGIGFDLVLQRRMNPDLPAVQGTLNPFVEVDRIRVIMTDFDLVDGSNPIDIFDGADDNKGVARFKSTQRQEILDDGTRGVTQVSKIATPHRFHTMKGSKDAVKPDVLGINEANLNDKTIAASLGNPAVQRDLWQTHFDRDYASTAELLNLPVVGPNLITQRLERMRYPGYQQFHENPLATTPVNPLLPTPADANDDDPGFISSAEAMFLVPDFTNTSPAVAITDSANDNRWYRLFQFVEIPSRVNRMLGEFHTQGRVPGKLNLNMIRHLEVFAGLIDDPLFADTDNDRVNSPFLTGNAPGVSGRDRWHEFIQERDGAINTYYDPTPNDKSNGDGGWARYWIPGTPAARPFRPAGYRARAATGSDNGLEDTIFRHLSGDQLQTTVNPFGEATDDPASNRNWMEVGSRDFHADPDNCPNPAVTSTTIQRQQILSKVLNNTTTTSNAFIVFATAGYFEAYEDPDTGIWRVGGRIDLEGGDNANPGYQQRAVFVVDRSELLNGYDPGTGEFDWERLVQYRADLE